jgi:hypothetical protein
MQQVINAKSVIQDSFSKVENSSYDEDNSRY